MALVPVCVSVLVHVYWRSSWCWSSCVTALGWMCGRTNQPTTVHVQRCLSGANVHKPPPSSFARLHVLVGAAVAGKDSGLVVLVVLV
jgi:hypothetical protein